MPVEQFEGLVGSIYHQADSPTNLSHPAVKVIRIPILRQTIDAAYRACEITAGQKEDIEKYLAKVQERLQQQINN